MGSSRLYISRFHSLRELVKWRGDDKQMLSEFQNWQEPASEKWERKLKWKMETYIVMLVHNNSYSLSPTGRLVGR